MSEDAIIQPDDDLLRQQQEAAQVQQAAEQGDPTTQGLGEAAVVQTQQEGDAVEQDAVIGLAGAEQQTAPEVTQEEPPQYIPHESEPQTDTSKRVDDEDIAREMAYAGKGERSDAADTRRDVAAEKAFKDQLHDIVSDPRYLDTSLRYKLLVFLSKNSALQSPTRPVRAFGEQLPDEASKWAIEELGKLREATNEENRDIPWNHRYKTNRSATTDIWEGRYNPDAPFREKDLAEAEELDASADVREEWVQFVREHPVSEEYKAAHPGFTFEPWEMQRLEGLVDLQNGQEWGEALLGEEHLDEPQNVSFSKVTESLQVAVEKLAEKGGEAEAELLEQYKTITVDPATTLGDLMALNKSIRQRHNEIISARVEERRQVLKDVKSGAASRPPEPTEQQQAA